MNALAHPLCKPSIISYLHHANPLAIIETRPGAQDYLINDFLQLVARRHHVMGLPPGLLVDFYSYDGMYPRYPLLSHAWLSAPTVRCLGGNVIEQIIALLDNGHYVEALLDEYYVANRVAYQKLHYLHQNLIYGYDRQRACFLTQGFDAQWAFATMEMPFAQVQNGFVEGSGLALFSWNDNPDFGRTRPFSAAIIRTSLEDFLARRSSFLSYQPEGVHYGADCYRVALALLDGARGAQIDIRPWCVFYEHKQKLLQLAQYLAAQALAPGAELINGLSWLSDDFMTLRNHILEVKLADECVEVASLEQEIAQLVAQEESLIAQLLQLLQLPQLLPLLPVQS